MIRKLAVLFGAGLASALVVAADQPASATAPKRENSTPPPLEMIFAPPAYRALKIAPDGGSYCVVSNVKGTDVLTLVDLASGKATPLLRTDDRIVSYWWKNRDLLLILAERKDSQGFQTFNLKTNEAGNRFPGHALISLLPDEPEEVLIGRFTNFDLDLSRYNVRTERSTPHSAMSNYVRNWLTDRQGKVVCGFGVFKEKWFVQFPKDNGWRRVELGERQWADFTPVFVTADGSQIVGFDASGGDTMWVSMWNPTTDAREPLIASESLDPDFLSAHTNDWTVMQAITYETDRPKQTFVAPEDQAIADQLARAVPQASVFLDTASVDKSKIIVRANREEIGETFYLFDVARKKLGSARPGLSVAGMATSRYLEFPARDGLELHARLYTPPSGHAPYPTVVIPRWNDRTRFGFSPQAQALATRGYAVLEVDVRGASGYGEKFRAAGMMEISGKMVDDLLDALDFFGTLGQIDSRRMALLGYGLDGLVACHAAMNHPDRFAALISFWLLGDLDKFHYKNFVRANLTEAEIKDRFGGETGIRRYLDKLGVAAGVPQLRPPSFHYGPIFTGQALADPYRALQKQIQKRGAPHVYVEGKEIESFSAFMENTTAATSAEWVRIYSLLLPFLEQHLGKK
jgi:dipeptidyl aminopeptidase/acylaminoacyl peptidase